MKIREYFGLNNVAGEVGIEIEVEGGPLPIDLPYFWKTENDGSLRGNSAEYVLKKPVQRNSVQKALNHLVSQMNKRGANLLPSDRCGVHVHINCQELHVKEMINFACLYWLFEKTLMRWCGDDREGNLFCLRSSDAEFIVHLLKKAIQGGSLGTLQTDNIRYSSLNFLALSQYGSLEFRGMGTPNNLLKIKDWVDFLLALKDKSFQYDNVAHIIEQMSGNGTEKFVKDIFGDLTGKLTYPDIDNDLYDSIRLIQEIAYIDFNGFKKHVWEDAEVPKENLNIAEAYYPEPDENYIPEPGDLPDPFVPIDNFRRVWYDVGPDGRIRRHNPGEEEEEAVKNPVKVEDRADFLKANAERDMLLQQQLDRWEQIIKAEKRAVEGRENRLEDNKLQGLRPRWRLDNEE